jgi:hypothetical protein
MADFEFQTYTDILGIERYVLNDMPVAAYNEL